MQRAQRRDRHGVARGEQRGRRVRHAEQRAHRGVGERGVGEAGDHQRRVAGQPGGLQPGPVAGETLAAVAFAEKGDTGVAVRGEVPNARRRAGRVGRDHGVDVEPARHAGDADHRRPRGHLGREVRLVVTRRHEDQAVDAARGERGDQRPLPSGVAVDARSEHHQPAGRRGVLHRAQDGRGERVGDVVEQQADRRGAGVGAAQDAGADVRPEAEFVDRPPDPLGERGRHPRLVVHHPGHGLEADPGPGGDVAQGRPPAVAHRRVLASPVAASARGCWSSPESLSSAVIVAEP